MIQPEDELTALLTLSKIEGLGLKRGHILYSEAGSALEIFRRYKELNDILPGVTKDISSVLDDSGSLFMARKEVQFIREHGIRALTPEDNDYPERLRECEDAPLVLFSMGNVDYNVKHVVGIVGTRRATEYGRQMTDAFIKKVSETCPGTLFVSGLAYGIDIECHKACMKYGAPTVGVLAHGLDRIYPAAHRKYAKEMLQNGGLATEFQTGIFPDKFNFVQRNRIIAGLSDAVLVVESAAKGGSLITAEFAEMYSRDCFAFPGNVGEMYSEGCNHLIRDNKAALICSGEDFLVSMGWAKAEDAKGAESAQLELFSVLDKLSDKERQIFLALQNAGRMGLHVNDLSHCVGISISELMGILFTMEIEGYLRPVPGGFYRLVQRG